MTLLDTHIWIWSIANNARLKREHKVLIQENQNDLWISVVSCWEIAMLVAKGRLDLGRPTQDWFEFAITESGVLVLPLSPRIAADAYSLPGRFHDDPAHRMIVATARNRKALLLTEDDKILNYSHVRTA